MHNYPIYILNVEISPTETLKLELNEEQSMFYLGRLPQHCSRNNLFNVLELVKKNRPYHEIDFFEKIVLQTKNEYYKMSFQAIPAEPKADQSNETKELFKDIRITPERDRFLVLVCYEGTIVSPSHFCGKHFHVLGGNGVRQSTIYKWAYLDDVYKQLGLTPMDPELSKQIHAQAKAESETEKRAEPSIKILEVIVEVLKEVTKDGSNEPKRPFH
ncbi:hypothetical protein MMO38_00280 [Acinetobacter sp. NIPH 1852]|uniref:hypothetical protein n=1 Tax=Acinetobacter sp. NIPH 1852 TaxID=2923428 RepID=UPI001F4BA6AB|nr:hypothetical protein [Acinetobacter sp. NIPH 1852]MCH7306583.1 hypothetical protein [Acinetobacter sp. NIPH 1852]